MISPQQRQPAYATTGPTAISYGSRQNYSMSLMSMVILSVLVHALSILLAFIVVLVLQFFGFTIPLFEPLNLQQRDLEFVLVDNPTAPPRDKNTKNRAERATRSGGEVVKNQPKVEPQRAAGNPAKSAQPKAASKPQPKQQAVRKASQSAPKATKAPTPKQPTPPQPKIPKTTTSNAPQPVAPPNPVAPTIKTPMPSAPKTVSGPVVKTASTSGSGGSGNVGPQQIPGGPISRSQLASASPGSSGSYNPGGSGGRGTFNQSGSPGGGGGAPGVDALPEPDFGPYMAELQRRIRRNWNPPKEDRSKRVVALFTISRDGRLVNIRLQNSSGSQVADDAAMAAVRASAPFRPLPAGYRKSTIDVQFTFDYEVSGGSIR